MAKWYEEAIFYHIYPLDFWARPRPTRRMA